MKTDEEQTTGAGKKLYRLALVMNGGVSLAVWMAGVVTELDVARRASIADELPPECISGMDCSELDEHEKCVERRHFLLWRTLLRTLDSAVEVDIIAGTSAGGLNGALLASTIGLGGRLPDLRHLWMKEAVLREGKLLRKEGPKASSVLDGARFYEIVEDALKKIKPTAGAVKSAQDITLFMTATILGARSVNYQDSYGQRYSAPDHRRLYRFDRVGAPLSYSLTDRDGPGVFKKSNKEKSDFDKLGPLAEAIRASASFPIAFYPVRESDGLAAFADRVHGDSTWLMDGGVLDNAPFGPVLSSIRGREAQPRVSRILAYVVPSSGLKSPEGGLEKVAPRWLDAAFAAAGFPSESDLRDDLEDLKERLEASGRERDSLAVLFDLAIGDSSRREVLLRAADVFFPEYRRARISRGLTDFRSLLASQSNQARDVEVRTVDPADEVSAVPWVPNSPVQLTTGTTWTYGMAAAERCLRIMLRVAQDRFQKNDENNPAGEAVSTISKSIRELVTLDRAVDGALTSRGLSLDASYEQLASVSWQVFKDLRVNETAGFLLLEGVKVFSRLIGKREDAILSSLLATEVISSSVKGRSEEPLLPSFNFSRIGPDSTNSLLERSRELGDRKLFGTRAAHFGAFGDERWRAWDFQWGRLDAAAALARIVGVPDEGGISVGASSIGSVETLTESIARNECFSVDSLRDGLIELDDVKDKELFEIFKSTMEGGNAVKALYSAAVAFVHAGAESSPPQLSDAAKYLYSVLSLQRPESYGLKPWAARRLSGFLRSRIKGYLAKPKTSKQLEFLAGFKPPISDRDGD